MVLFGWIYGGRYTIIETKAEIKGGKADETAGHREDRAGKRTVDGAGVRLVRVLGNRDVYDFDPFLMLDSFDSTDPADYIAGFPTHPHRGIETITYLIAGEVEHRDSLGNHGVIRAEGSQWMTAGSGILHQEMPQPAPRMLGLQLWLNLPRAEKMTAPAYFDITRDLTAKTKAGAATVRVISGQFNGAAGATAPHVPASMFDVQLPAGEAVEIPAPSEETTFLFLIEGGALVNGRTIPPKTAVLFGPGDFIAVAAPGDANARFVFFSAPPLREPIAWGGPIVMNTEEELRHAFTELRDGTFIKHR